MGNDMFNDEQLAHAEIVQKETEDALAWWKSRALAAESRAERLGEALREIDARTGHFGEAPPPPEWMPMLSLIAWVGRISRAALGEEEE